MTEIYFRDVPQAQRHSDAHHKCIICGYATESNSNPLPEHDPAVHEVFAFETWGMRSVDRDMRPFVEAWSKGLTRLPTRQEFLAKRASLR